MDKIMIGLNCYSLTNGNSLTVIRSRRTIFLP